MEVNKGGAPLGNSNALKWNPDKAKLFIDNVYNYVRNNDKCRSLALACSENDSYEDVLYYLKTIFTDEEVDFSPIKKAEAIIKGRLMEQALENDVNATMAIFILKNNHGMADKVEQKTDHTTKGESINVISLGNGVKPPTED